MMTSEIRGLRAWFIVHNIGIFIRFVIMVISQYLISNVCGSSSCSGATCISKETILKIWVKETKCFSVLLGDWDFIYSKFFG